MPFFVAAVLELSFSSTEHRQSMPTQCDPSGPQSMHHEPMGMASIPLSLMLCSNLHPLLAVPCLLLLASESTFLLFHCPILPPNCF